MYQPRAVASATGAEATGSRADAGRGDCARSAAGTIRAAARAAARVYRIVNSWVSLLWKRAPCPRGAPRPHLLFAAPVQPRSGPGVSPAGRRYSPAPALSEGGGAGGGGGGGGA